MGCEVSRNDDDFKWIGLDWIGEMVSSCIYCDGDDGMGCIGFWVMHDA